MRVTNKMLANNFLTDMTTNINYLKVLQQQLTSGKEVRRPSDNPFKVARAMQMHSDISANEQYNENIKDTINWLDETDTALGQLGNQFQRIRELLISSGNAAYGTDERKKNKDEINEIVGQISQTLNSNFDGSYIFSGTRTTTKPVNTKQEVLLSQVEGPGKAEINGEYTGENSSTYKIKISEVDGSVPPKATKIQVSTDGGNTFGSSITRNSEGEFEIGDGLSFKIEDDASNAIGSEYKFSATKTGNSQLIYNGRTKIDIPELTQIKIDTSKISENWGDLSADKKVTFNIEDSLGNVTAASIDIDKNVSDIDGLVNDLNNKISLNGDLNGKIKFEKVVSGEETYLRATSLTNDEKISIDSNVTNTTVTEATIKDICDKYISDGKVKNTSTEIQPMANVKVNDVNDWNGKDINFKINTLNGSIDRKITIPATNGTIEDLEEKINSEIGKDNDLKNKVKTEIFRESDGSNAIRFTSLSEESNVFIKSEGTTVKDIEDSGICDKLISDKQIDMIDSKLVTEVSQGVNIEYSVSASDIINFKDRNGNECDLREILKNIVDHLDSGDIKDVEKITNEDLKNIDNVMDNILKLRSEVGAKQKRMEGAKEKNESENFNMTEILSKTEDINITEKIMEYATMQTVYLASLQTSAKVLQPTIMDYLT